MLLLRKRGKALKIAGEIEIYSCVKDGREYSNQLTSWVDGVSQIIPKIDSMYHGVRRNSIINFVEYSFKDVVYGRQCFTTNYKENSYRFQRY